jgi:hypothetical protein
MTMKKPDAEKLHVRFDYRRLMSNQEPVDME